MSHFNTQVTAVGTFSVGSFFGSLFSQILMRSLRSMQEVNVSDSVKLLDSPGVIVSPTNPQVSLALRGLMVEEGKASVLEAVRCLLKQCDQTLVGRISIARNTECLFLIEVIFSPQGYAPV